MRSLDKTYIKEYVKNLLRHFFTLSFTNPVKNLIYPTHTHATWNTLSTLDKNVTYKKFTYHPQAHNKFNKSSNTTEQISIKNLLNFKILPEKEGIYQINCKICEKIYILERKEDICWLKALIYCFFPSVFSRISLCSTVVSRHLSSRCDSIFLY